MLIVFTWMILCQHTFFSTSSSFRFVCTFCFASLFGFFLFLSFLFFTYLLFCVYVPSCVSVKETFIKKKHKVAQRIGSIVSIFLQECWVLLLHFTWSCTLKLYLQNDGAQNERRRDLVNLAGAICFIFVLWLHLVFLLQIVASCFYFHLVSYKRHELTTADLESNELKTEKNNTLLLTLSRKKALMLDVVFSLDAIG